MFNYIIFMIRCILGKFNFFKLSPRKKAIYLKKCKLDFEAGSIYMKNGYYAEAISCFKRCDAYRHLIHCYEKQGQLSLAIEIADKHHLYKKGASLSMRYQNPKKAAYFYSFFDLPHAIKLYKKLECYYDLGLCYMSQYRFSLALDAFSNCSTSLEKLKGFRLIEEVSIVLYLTHQYDEAIKLFTELRDYYSVLECAKKLKDSSLIASTSKFLATYEFAEGNYVGAAYYIAPYDKNLARLYYYLSAANNDTLALAIYEQDYFKALQLSFQLNNLLLAKQISKLWLIDPPTTHLNLIA